MKHIFTLLMIMCAQSTQAEPPAREALGGITPTCEFAAPEDIEALPDGSALIVGSLGRRDGTLGGGIQVYYPRDGQIDTIYMIGRSRRNDRCR